MSARLVSLILSWVLFPLVLALVGAGWGALVERASGTRINPALVLPLGLATALVVSGTLTAFSATAPTVLPVVTVGALAGLPLAWSERGRFDLWALVAAAGALLFFGAPVLLSGEATFAGFVRLDDTATWFNNIDHLFTHTHSFGDKPQSTYSLGYEAAAGTTYPRGSFLLPALAREMTGIDIAWVFQPYLACCGAAAALCLYALIEPIVPSSRIRALVAFLAAQSALLYGYSLWGGIKELTASFLLVLAVALTAPMLRKRPEHPRALIAPAIAAGAFVQTLGAGAAGWVVLMFGVVAVAWLWQGLKARKPLPGAISIAWLGAFTAASIIPVWVVLSDFLSTDSSLFSSGQSEAVRLGNLIEPLSAFQLAGIWPVGDFRLTPPQLPTVLLIGLALVAAIGATWVTIRRREFGLALYLGVALGGCGLIYLAGATPWVVGKTLAIAAPALLVAALAGAAMLCARKRALGFVVLAILAGGVLWSNALAYNEVLLAPRARLAELQRIGDLVAGKGPTLQNEYEIYGDRHFLRAGDPVEPAEYREALLALSNGTLLTKSAWADLDSFPLSTLEEYRSIVTRRSPAESRPPSNYRLVWRGDYYDLWQRPASPATNILEHIPYGESTKLPFCGASQNGAPGPECSVNPVATPPCAQILALARSAASRKAVLVAYQRPKPIVARADQTLWPGLWLHDPVGHTLTANTPGTDVARIGVVRAQPYELWLGGNFSRGFKISVDGQSLGRVKNQLSAIGGYIHVADLFLEPGVHKFEITYPDSDLSPGSGDNTSTSLSAISLQPTEPAGRLLTVPPREARRLCGRPLDWIEVVAAPPPPETASHP